MMVTSFADLPSNTPLRYSWLKNRAISADEKFGPYEAVNFSTSGSTLGRRDIVDVGNRRTF